MKKQIYRVRSGHDTAYVSSKKEGAIIRVGYDSADEINGKYDDACLKVKTAIWSRIEAVKKWGRDAVEMATDI